MMHRCKLYGISSIQLHVFKLKGVIKLSVRRKQEFVFVNRILFSDTQVCCNVRIQTGWGTGVQVPPRKITLSSARQLNALKTVKTLVPHPTPMTKLFGSPHGFSFVFWILFYFQITQSSTKFHKTQI